MLAELAFAGTEIAADIAGAFSEFDKPVPPAVQAADKRHRANIPID
jgi:hypothetical protein